MRSLAWCLALLMVGCNSVNVGTSLPIPGPVKPAVGVTFSKTGVKGNAGVGTRVGPVSVGTSGSTEELKYKSSKPILPH